MTKNPNLKTVCDNCSATYIVKHDLPEDYIETTSADKYTVNKKIIKQ